MMLGTQPVGSGLQCVRIVDGQERVVVLAEGDLGGGQFRSMKVWPFR